MINASLFTAEKLVAAILDDRCGNDDLWKKRAEIIPKYMPPFPSEDTRPRCVVRLGESFLRYSCGPRQGYFWDVYGEDFLTPELALLALAKAPVPPSLLRAEAWPTRVDT